MEEVKGSQLAFYFKKGHRVLILYLRGGPQTNRHIPRSSFSSSLIFLSFSASPRRLFLTWRAWKGSGGGGGKSIIEKNVWGNLKRGGRRVEGIENATSSTIVSRYVVCSSWSPYWFGSQGQILLAKKRSNAEMCRAHCISFRTNFWHGVSIISFTQLSSK